MKNILSALAVMAVLTLASSAMADDSSELKRYKSQVTDIIANLVRTLTRLNAEFAPERAAFVAHPETRNVSAKYSSLMNEIIKVTSAAGDQISSLHVRMPEKEKQSVDLSAFIKGLVANANKTLKPMKISVGYIGVGGSADTDRIWNLTVHAPLSAIGPID
jgi:hypothetical protein